MRNISSFNLDHLPEESLCIQSGIHCIYLLWRSRDRCSSLCLRCTAGSLNRSHCSHTPTYKHTKNPNFIQTWKHQRKTLYVVTVYNANLYLSATMLSQFCVRKVSMTTLHVCMSGEKNLHLLQCFLRDFLTY